MTLLLTNADVAKIIDMRRCLEVLEEAYKDLGRDEAVNRIRSDMYVPTPKPGAYYLLKTMEGAVVRQGVSAIRISSDIWVERDVDGHHRIDRVPAQPSGKYVGLVLLFSIDTCQLVAIIHGGLLQQYRVGATYGLGTKVLARQDAARVAVLGSAGQARSQLTAVAAVRNLTSVHVYSPTREHREGFAKEMSARLALDIIPTEEPRAALQGADIVIAATSAAEPVFSSSWLEPGTHVHITQP
ncbi:MAG: ornithine cyclodeaminase family protein, partial [Chloroflexi bacterium]|nr:ornithine cyclodeaminase family protein [Chloroflexota bacterium]